MTDEPNLEIEAAEAAAPAVDVTPKADPFAALRYRDYRLYLGGSVLSNIGGQMLTTAVGWELYQRTGSALALGLVGLVQILPIIFLSLPAGHIADCNDRKLIVVWIQLLNLAVAAGLAAVSWTKGPVWLVYVCLLGAGIARAFQSPARSSLLPQIVRMSAFRNAATWNSSAFEMSAMLGPAAAGLVIGWLKSPASVYIIDCVAAVAFALMIGLIRGKQGPKSTDPLSVSTLMAGLRFLRDTREVLACIMLDMFAVLLGGAVTLLPIYASDILKVGPEGFGLLRAAPSVGAITMALVVANLPPFKRAGRTLLIAVAGFGAAIIVFGLSRTFWVSMGALALAGAMDNISVVIRHTLVQLRTPDWIRGRVQAVNFIFIGTSNELGGFESGVVASLFGPVVSVVSGGIGTVLVVLGVAWLFPEIRHLRDLHEDKN